MDTQLKLKTLLTYLGALAIAIASSATLKAVPNEAHSDLWHTDIEEAQKIATETEKPILIKFTGSDWCPPCMKLAQDVFSKDTFAEWAKDNVVLVYADFPRRAAISDKQKKHNETLATNYSIKGFPTVVLTNAEGKEIARTGFRRGGPEAYTKHLDELIAKPKK